MRHYHLYNGDSYDSNMVFFLLQWPPGSHFFIDMY